MARRRKEANYEVGYRRPPAATRFKPGQSGNPRGRPRGTKNVDTILRNFLMRKIPVIEGGKRRMITVLEAFLKRLAKQALDGDARAGDKLIRLLPYLAEASSAGDEGAAIGDADVASSKASREMLRYFFQMARDGDFDLDIEREPR